jgi:glycosyltransferase involved in cell wall biosynthesis
MTVEAFILNWNEELLHLTIKHYQEFCNKITILDNYSTDGSDKVAEAMGCHVVKFGQPGVLSDAAYRKLKNTCWKGSQADWVIVCDADEILHHNELNSILHNAHEEGLTIFNTQGVNIYSHEIPIESFSEITTGLLDNNYSKRIIFNPRRIQEINYEYGAHECRPQGAVTFSKETLFLLHYRNVGGPERIIRRHADYRKRLSPDNKRFGLGVHYTYEDERRVREWHEYYANCKELSELGILF